MRTDLLMNQAYENNTDKRQVRSSGRARLLVFVMLLISMPATALAASTEPLFGAPPAAIASDEILLISTRNVGTDCTDESMRQGLQCQRLVTKPTGQTLWETSDWRRALSASSNVQTVVYVHGNRVAAGEDRSQGMQVYRSLKSHAREAGPIRFIIWSWPSTQIPGPIKDYVVKARRTNPAAWQLAWLLEKLPVETPITLVGYSYGTRVVSGATHLLAGGRLGQLQLAQQAPARRPPMRSALLAAAYDVDWIEPGHFYGRALEQLERVVLGTNQRDPAMRFYYLSNGLGRIHALGKSGIDRRTSLGDSAQRLKNIDFTHEVGRSHSLADYLASDDKMSVFWGELMRTHIRSLAN